MMRHETTIVLVTLLAILIGSGTVFFHFVEGWSWLNSYFFTVVTLSTVGYGELVPATPLGKIATTLYILAGLGVFAAAIQHVGRVTVTRRLKARADLREAQRKAAEAEKRLEAAEEKGPDA